MIVGTVKRIVKEPDYIYYLLIPVCYSPSEKRYHRILPNFLVPYKQYTVETIKQAANDEQDLDLHNLPSDSSRIRWKKLINRRSEPKHSDSSSLSCLLHVNPFSVTASSVTLSVIIHWFTPGELAGLLNQPIYNDFESPDSAVLLTMAPKGALYVTNKPTERHSCIIQSRIRRH